MRYHNIYLFGQMWDEDAISKEAHTVEGLSKLIERISDFKAELSGFRSYRTCGAIAVSAVGLKSTLDGIQERSLEVTMQLLNSLARKKCAATSQQVAAAAKALDERPTTARSVKTYKVLCEAAEAQLSQSEATRFELETAWRLLMKQGFRLSVEDQLAHDELHGKCRDLREVKLPKAQAHLESLPADIVVSISNDAVSDGHSWPLAEGLSGSERSSLRSPPHEEAHSPSRERNISVGSADFLNQDEDA